ncbi:MAG: hypothetical protein ACE5I1_01570 [bacterium]
MFAFIFSILLANSNPTSPPTDFWGNWGDGRAELSSYKLTLPRYGELREGYSVMIFVTEDISRKTRIKVESGDIPKSERVPVLKLNRVVKFTTGIYDYSIMTSTFSSVEPELGRPALEPLKISFSAQEWCGHIYQMLIPQKSSVDLTMHSYFQREGDQQKKLSLPQNAVYEDNLPIRIRELKGQEMALGGKHEVKILPALWHLRAGHIDAGFQSGWIKKEEGETIEVLGKQTGTWKWSWQVGERTETYWVEKSGANRIVRFESSDGTKGELQASIREPYWRLHDNDDLPFRERLRISNE